MLKNSALKQIFTKYFLVRYEHFDIYWVIRSCLAFLQLIAAYIYRQQSNVIRSRLVMAIIKIYKHMQLYETGTQIHIQKYVVQKTIILEQVGLYRKIACDYT